MCTVDTSANAQGSTAVTVVVQVGRSFPFPLCTSLLLHHPLSCGPHFSVSISVLEAVKIWHLKEAGGKT